MLKNDKWIKEQALKGMIEPFEPELVREIESVAVTRPYLEKGIGSCCTQKRCFPVISYGLSSYGYDIRLSPNDFRIFRHIPGTVVDPKNFNPSNLEHTPIYNDDNGVFFILPAHSYGLGVAFEKLEIPDNITCLFIGKSTYARVGVIANLTPGEAGWRGYLTLEFSNSSSTDCRIYANEGVVQALFFEGEPCETSYQDRAGKYQDQPASVVLAKV